MTSVPSSSPVNPQTQVKLSDASESFALKLRAIGGLSVDEFLNTSEEDLPPIRYDFGFPNATSPWFYKPQETAASPDFTAIQQLENACQETFGRTDVLQYGVVFQDPSAPSAPGMRGVLHIVKNKRTRRTYTGTCKHETEVQAREEVAQVALREGALTYILNLEPENSVDPADPEEASDPVKVIEGCFSRWRPGLKAPQWFTYEHGAALKVQLASGKFRVYSTPEDTKFDALVLCAQIAIDSGVLEFIKFGDGQIRPSPNLLTSDTKDAMLWSNVQEFVETLPRPFPEPKFEDKPQIMEDEILQWFNGLRQDANKSRTNPLETYFHFLQVKHAYGCILRIEPPESDPKQARTYLVEPRFSKKVKSKVGVCIQAMSENVGGFLRVYFPVKLQATSTAITSITPDMRRYANEKVWPAVREACREIGPQAVTTIHYPNNAGSIGCILKAVVPPTPIRKSSIGLYNTGSVSRKWSVPTTFSSRDDARVALLCETGEELVQFIKSQGTLHSFAEPPRAAKKLKQENLMAAPMHSSGRVKRMTGAKKQDVSQRQAQATVGPKMTPKDWDKETHQPNIDLTYEYEPGEIVDNGEVSVAGPSMTSHSPSSGYSRSDMSQSSGISNLKRKRGLE